MLRECLKALLQKQQGFRTWSEGSTKGLGLNKVFKAGACAGVRNRGHEDWAGSRQGAMVGALRVGEGGRVTAGKKGTKGKEARLSQTCMCMQGRVHKMFLQRKSMFSSP